MQIMKEEKYYLEMDRYDKSILINALNELRSKQLSEERPADPINELILKVSEAPLRKGRNMTCRADAER